MVDCIQILSRFRRQEENYCYYSSKYSTINIHSDDGVRKGWRIPHKNAIRDRYLFYFVSFPCV